MKEAECILNMGYLVFFFKAIIVITFSSLVFTVILIAVTEVSFIKKVSIHRLSVIFDINTLKMILRHYSLYEQHCFFNFS